MYGIYIHVNGRPSTEVYKLDIPVGDATKVVSERISPYLSFNTQVKRREWRKEHLAGAKGVSYCVAVSRIDAISIIDEEEKWMADLERTFDALNGRFSDLPDLKDICDSTIEQTIVESGRDNKSRNLNPYVKFSRYTARNKMNYSMGINTVYKLKNAGVYTPNDLVGKNYVEFTKRLGMNHRGMETIKNVAYDNGIIIDENGIFVRDSILKYTPEPAPAATHKITMDANGLVTSIEEV